MADASGQSWIRLSRNPRRKQRRGMRLGFVFPANAAGRVELQPLLRPGVSVSLASAGGRAALGGTPRAL